MWSLSNKRRKTSKRLNKFVLEEMVVLVRHHFLKLYRD